MNLTINLPNNLMEILHADMEDEFQIAQRKWEYTLTEDQIENIRRRAFEQLKLKMKAYTGADWNFEPTVSFSVQHNSVTTEEGEETVSYTIPSDEAIGGYMSKEKNGMVFQAEWTEGLISLQTAHEWCLALLRKYVRTAVFYGVGSYRIG